MNRPATIGASLLSLALLFSPAAATAQTRVSFSVLNNFPYDCYVAALTVAKSRISVRADAISTCDAALTSPIFGKNRAATFDNRGIVYDSTGDYSAALADYDSSIKLDPTLGDAWLNRGVALIRLKRPEEALPDIERGIALGPNMQQVAYYDLGVAQQSLGHVREAYDAYKRALAADPSFAPAADALKNFRVIHPG